LLHFWWPHRNPVHIYFAADICHVAHLSHSAFDHLNSICCQPVLLKWSSKPTMPWNERKRAVFPQYSTLLGCQSILSTILVTVIRHGNGNWCTPVIGTYLLHGAESFLRS
jgi:hypothetical protein